MKNKDGENDKNKSVSSLEEALKRDEAELTKLEKELKEAKKA
jgi:hypothetical protein